VHLFLLPCQPSISQHTQRAHESFNDSQKGHIQRETDGGVVSVDLLRVSHAIQHQ
jgi:hypothetical protein